MPGSVPRIVIVGGGFGGLAAAKALKNAPAEIVLIDRANHHLFQPLLYQVATAVLAVAGVTIVILTPRWLGALLLAVSFVYQRDWLNLRSRGGQSQ